MDRDELLEALKDRRDRIEWLRNAEPESDQAREAADERIGVLREEMQELFAELSGLDDDDEDDVPW
jgi:hypothetical protein